MNNPVDLLIANAELAADLLQHMADNEIDSDYFAVVTDSPNCGREVQSEHSVTEVALMAAGIIEQLIAQLEAEKNRPVIRQKHADWSNATFGNVGPVGPLKHLSKEALETAASPDDLSEWADMQFLFWDAQRRAGITDAQIEQAMIDKLEINKSRTWPEPKDGESREHIKAGFAVKGE